MSDPEAQNILRYAGLPKIRDSESAERMERRCVADLPQVVAQDVSLREWPATFRVKNKTGGVVPDEVFQHCGERRWHVNVPNGIIRFRVLLSSAPHALADMDGLAIARDRRTFLGRLTDLNREGFPDAKTRSGKQGIKHPVPATDLRQNIGDFLGFNCRGVLLLRFHNRQVNIFMIPLAWIDLLAAVVNRRSNDGFHHRDDLNDGFGRQPRFR